MSEAERLIGLNVLVAGPRGPAKAVMLMLRQHGARALRWANYRPKSGHWNAAVNIGADPRSLRAQAMVLLERGGGTIVAQGPRTDCVTDLAPNGIALVWVDDVGESVIDALLSKHDVPPPPWHE